MLEFFRQDVIFCSYAAVNVMFFQENSKIMAAQGSQMTFEIPKILALLPFFFFFLMEFLVAQIQWRIQKFYYTR